jgi:hypothetical protein
MIQHLIDRVCNWKVNTLYIKFIRCPRCRLMGKRRHNCICGFSDTETIFYFELSEYHIRVNPLTNTTRIYLGDKQLLSLGEALPANFNDADYISKLLLLQ